MLASRNPVQWFNERQLSMFMSSIGGGGGGTQQINKLDTKIRVSCSTVNWTLLVENFVQGITAIEVWDLILFTATGPQILFASYDHLCQVSNVLVHSKQSQRCELLTQ